MEYVHLYEQEYTESGADSLDLEMDSRDSHSLQSDLGLSISRLCNLKTIRLVPKLKIKWLHEFLSESLVTCHFSIVVKEAHTTSYIEKDSCAASLRRGGPNSFSFIQGCFL